MKRYLFYLYLLLLTFCGPSYGGELREWILSKISTDDQLLEDAFNQRNGYSVELLKSSKTYVPFFLERPSSVQVGTDVNQDAAFEQIVGRYKGRLLPGGYVLRIRFETAPPLYALSAGDWDGEVWHNLTLSRDLRVSPLNVWDAKDGSYLYGTLLAGFKPKLIVYDNKAEVSRQMELDATSPDFDEKLQKTLDAEPRSATPLLEMISLAEYLQDPESPWRAVDIQGNFNLRNQHERGDEQEKLKQVRPLTRSSVTGGLDQEFDATIPKPSPQPDSPSSSMALLLSVAALIILILLWLLSKRRS